MPRAQSHLQGKFSFPVQSCNHHLSALPQLDPLLVGPAANLDSDRLRAGHPTCSAWHRAEQVFSEVALKGFVLPDDDRKGVRPTHLSTSKHIFAVAMEVKHFLVEAPGW